MFERLLDRLSIQSYLAFLLSSATVGLIFLLVLRGGLQSADDVTKTAIGAMLTVGFATIIQFYFGSSQKEGKKDDAMAAIAAMPSANNGASPWWSKLNETEKTVIGANAKDDPRMNAIAQAMATGSATADDLAYLVSRGVITQSRADTIKS